MDTLKPRTSPLRFAIGMFGGVLTASFFTAQMAFYYVDVLKLDMKIYSAALLLYSILDAIDNPTYGFLCDKTRTRFGRRRPWLILGILLSTVGMIAFFCPPDGMSGAAFVTYFIVTMLLVETSISMIQVSYGALFPDLFKKPQERAKTNSLRQAFQFIASIIAVGLTPMIVEKIGYQWTAIILSVVGGGIYLYSAIGCREDTNYEDYKQPKLFSSIKEIVVNKKFWVVGVAGTMYGTTVALILAGIPFYTKYTLALKGAGTSILLGTVLITATVSIIFWNFLLKKTSLVTVWRIAVAVIAVALIPFFFANSLLTAVLAGMLVGIGMGGYVSTGDIVIASLIDEDTARYGVKREGMFISIMAFVNRLSGLIRSIAFFLLATLFGFISGDNPGQQPGEAAKFLLIVVPFVLMAIAFVTTWFLKLDTVKTEETVRE